MGLKTVSGRFRVTMTPAECHAQGQESNNIGLMALDKTFEGPLSGASRGDMISAMTPTKGSAGYVAIEQFSGSLEGREGGFIMQHFGMMDGGKDSLRIDIVPDSGTGALQGIRGSCGIRIEGNVHYYDLHYELN